MAILWTIFTLPLLLAGPSFWPWYFNWFAVPSFVQGVLWFLYSSFMDSTRGQTFGKMFMNLKVTVTDGKPPTFGLTVIRNISKIYWLLLLIDVIIGMATVGDPYQKYSDRFAGTTVVSTITRSMIIPAPPSPPVPTPSST